MGLTEREGFEAVAFAMTPADKDGEGKSGFERPSELPRRTDEMPMPRREMGSYS